MTAVSVASFEYVCSLVKREAAIVLQPGKEYLVSSRLGPIARREGASSVDALVDRMRLARCPGDLQREIVEALTTNETSWFRDVTPFDVLQKHVIPALSRKRSGRTLRIWSAACSTGQEPYSLAMMLLSGFPEVCGSGVSIVATDLNEQVLERAREGVYGQLEVGRGLPLPHLARFFDRCGAGWRVKPEVRRLVTFSALNLATAWATMEPFDLILVRNVLIYFDTETKTSVLRRAASLLEADGVLMLGAAESILGCDVPLQRVEVLGTSTYRRR